MCSEERGARRWRTAHVANATAVVCAACHRLERTGAGLWAHGNAMALYLYAINTTFGSEAWVARRNPEVLGIIHEAGQLL